ncbi:MAG: choice-of-anchor Q domain-containing protein [Rhodanobacteraceae bacterium]
MVSGMATYRRSVDCETKTSQPRVREVCAAAADVARRLVRSNAIRCPGAHSFLVRTKEGRTGCHCARRRCGFVLRIDSMARMHTPETSAPRKKMLPACVAALFAMHSIATLARVDPLALPAYGNLPPSPDKVRTVDTCNDSGPGSLRDAVFNAASGDVIDLTRLSCSEITLFSGEVAVTVSDLTLLGPGVGPEASHHLTIYGYFDRIFDKGMGTLTISGLKLAGGHYAGTLARGGCIFAVGDLVIMDSIVTGCEVDAPYGSNAFAAGGAIYSQGELWMRNSVITNNVAYSPDREAYGGGVFASYIVTIDASTIADNSVIAPQAYAVGGGVMITGFSDVNIANSTISGNDAEVAGGIRADTLGTTRIIDSTLSGNYASLYVGAGSFSNGPVELTNSTITRNSAYAYTPGIISNQAITVQSSILADNRAVATDSMSDVCAPSVGGSASLITASCSSTPADTIALCPRLGALKDGGGPTLTHALISGSPGMDVGNNTTPLVADQRGVLYPRVFGANADIGAYEWQGELGDDIFRAAFEDRCDRYD